MVLCESGPTGRALHDAFTSQGKPVIGQIIDYELKHGVMSWFNPSGGQEGWEEAG